MSVTIFKLMSIRIFQCLCCPCVCLCVCFCPFCRLDWPNLSLVFEIFGWSSLLRMKAALGCISMLRCERNGFQAV